MLLLNSYALNNSKSNTCDLKTSYVTIKPRRNKVFETFNFLKSLYLSQISVLFTKLNSIISLNIEKVNILL